MRNATLKASVMSEAPKARAIRISRMRPVMRDSIVRLLMVASALSRFKMGSAARGGGGSVGRTAGANRDQTPGARQSCIEATRGRGRCGAYYTVWPRRRPYIGLCVTPP